MPATPDPVALRVLRGDHVESVHRAHVVVATPTGDVLASHGDPDRPVFLRSAAKPFQVVPLVTSGAVDALGITDDEIALACASHNGEPAHVDTARAFLEKAGVPEEAVTCGVHAPFPESAKRRDGTNSPLHNNCSGKHAAMLALARHLGSPLEGYQQPDHPVQQRIREVIVQLTGVPDGDLAQAVDGCGVPTYRVPLRAGATAVARLADPKHVGVDLGEALDRVGAAMMAHPWHVAGTGRLDTDLADASHGLVAKVGAEGVQAVANRHQLLGLLLKVEDGARRAGAPVTVECLRQLGWLDARALETLGDHWHPALRNHAGEVVGRLDPVLELDLPGSFGHGST